MFKIGDFSKLSRISIRMLRHYNDIGLLMPKNIDEFTSYRYYDVSQLSIANRIQSLKNMGFSLETIKEILKEYEDADSLKKYLKLHYTQMKEKSDRIQKQLLIIETTIEQLEQGSVNMNYDVVIKNFPELKVISLRKVIPAYNDEGMLWGELNKELIKQKVSCANPCYAMAVFFDEGYKENDVDVEIRLAVLNNYKDTKDVKFKTTDPITAATVIVKGDYNQLTAVCEAIGNWINDNGYEIDGPMFNIYHVSPAMESNPDNWITEVCFPIKSK
ncbi:MerR family transcriptional regulator [Clostridium uliginosum]|uniref:DNA-binding transcriptional regulator, MerR family n=1 Tax=Clostridium uliginosum TaxID=119641 RepID=A0A1I1IQA8_9CLOT|nr:MerR family transcriptional regulator [Clostridium uliginosum]SFC38416.1 DNA-binding transcriptional regulator, MerR family [Clostridium uliginosum]